MEVWKPIEWSEGCLEVSNEGRIKSNMRDGRILKATPDKKGYLRLHVTVKRKRYALKVHRVVASAFLDNPLNLPQVNHKDGDKTNNNADNLEWVSNKQNARHAIESGLWENVFAASKRANEKQRVPVIATNVETGERIFFRSVNEAEKTLGTRHVSAVLNGKRNKAKGYTFERG